MNRHEEILHQSIAVTWHNKFRNNPEMFQRLICNWTNQDNGRAGNKARSMGVKKGITDWVYMREYGHVIWIELKVGDNTQSPEQIQFEKLCLLLGHQYVICREYEMFWKIIGIEI